MLKLGPSADKPVKDPSDKSVQKNILSSDSQVFFPRVQLPVPKSKKGNKATTVHTPSVDVKSEKAVKQESCPAPQIFKVNKVDKVSEQEIAKNLEQSNLLFMEMLESLSTEREKIAETKKMKLKSRRDSRERKVTIQITTPASPEAAGGGG
jgi:hypothetical protein